MDHSEAQWTIDHSKAEWTRTTRQLLCTEWPYRHMHVRRVLRAPSTVPMELRALSGPYGHKPDWEVLGPTWIRTR